MNFLSSLLPGVREMRTPLAVGAVWLVVAGLIASHYWGQVTAAIPAAETIWLSLTTATELTSTLPILAAAGFIAYLIGGATTPVSRVFSSGLSRFVILTLTRPTNPHPDRVAVAMRRVSDLETGAGRSKYGRVTLLDRLLVRYWNGAGPLWIYRAGEAAQARGWRRERLLQEATRVSYEEAGLPRSAADVFHTAALDEELDSLPMLLWSTAPDQYQEYDRVRAEGNFREGLTLPLLIVGVMLATIAWWLGLPLVAISLVFVFQAHGLRDEQREIIASALNTRLIRSPLAISTAEAIIRLHRTEDSDDLPVDRASLLALHATAYLEVNGPFDEAYDGAMQALGDEIDFTLDPQALVMDIRMKGRVVGRHYERVGAGDLLDTRFHAELAYRAELTYESSRNIWADFDGLDAPAEQREWTLSFKLRQQWQETSPEWGGEVIPEELVPYLAPSGTPRVVDGPDAS